MIRRVAIALVILAFAAGIGWGGWRVVEDRRAEEVLIRARGEAASGRFGEARRLLLTLPRGRASDPEALDLFATCEHAGGDYESALAAWSRIPPGSPLARGAALARARTLIGNLGRFAEAEPILEAALREPGRARLEIRHTLSQLYFNESRPDAMRRVTRDGWREWRDPASELRDLWQIDDATVEVESVHRVVDEAARKAPDDDRVRLAQAGLDFLEGHLDIARRRLDDCAGRRPDEPAIWLARLRLARAADDPDGARGAMAHLPPDALRESDRLDLLAWIAGRSGDVEGQRKVLEARIEIGPADPAAFEGLAVLCYESGRAARASELRRKKAELDRAKDRYRRLLSDSTPTEGFDELATLAEALNRPFEAYHWWDLAARRNPDDASASAALTRLAAHRAPERPVPSVAIAGLTPAPSPGASHTDPASTRAAVLPSFVDGAEAAGLKFTFDNGRSPLRQLPETTAGGVGLLDYDGDGRLDVYLVQGGPFPPRPDAPNTGDRLFRNKGDGTFEDATERSGIARMPRGYGHGVSVGDVDNDGRPDLFLTRWRSYALYRNRGDGTFEDITARSGLGGDRGWPTSAAFADLDNDGDLDLYVGHYIRNWDADHPTLCDRKIKPGVMADPDVRHDYCMPHPFPSEPDHLFRNDGGRFVDVTDEAGIVDGDGRGLGVVAADVDDDGRMDLFVANDTTANYLFHNLGGLKFEEIGAGAGVASNAEGAYQAGMGTAAGDLDGDGRLDLAVTNFYGESTSFYRGIGGGIFADRSAATGLAAASRYLLGFGIAMFDANDDGRLDLATANGHVVDNRPDAPLEMPCQLLVNGPDGRLSDASRQAGPPWSVPRLGRALASGDLDGDGRLDLVVVSQRSPLAFFRNGTKGGRSITLQLEGTKSNRDAVGAVATATVAGKTLRAWRTGGGSFQSSSDPRLHFGLGDATRAEAVEVRWPSGRVDRFPNLEAGRAYRLREGDAQAVRLP